MKKTLMAGLVGLLATAAFAGKDNVVVTFYTTGPDKYVDGKQVIDGESYALVWTPTGSTFAGFTADGKAVEPSVVALKAPVAKDGKCPVIKFEIDQDYAAKNYADGTWGVYLLDTRAFVTKDDGTVEATGAVGSAVNGYGVVGTGDGQFASASAATATSAAALPADKQDVKITNIKVADGKVFIYVSGTVSTASYTLNAGEAPNATAPAATQAGNTVGDMIIVRDAKVGGEFFSVNRK